MHSNSTIKYHLAARILHWIMLGGFVFMWICGYSMTNLVEDDSAFEELLYFLHISSGVTLFFALVARIVVRVLYKPPPQGMEISRIDRVGAHFAHALLYVLPFLIILVGWAQVDLGGHQVQWFGINIPKIFPTVEMWGSVEVDEVMEPLHMWLAYIMLGLAVVHVAAVLKHRWFDKHDILPRMTIWGRK